MEDDAAVDGLADADGAERTNVSIDLGSVMSIHNVQENPDDDPDKERRIGDRERDAEEHEPSHSLDAGEDEVELWRKLAAGEEYDFGDRECEGG